jgi:hypothetical protein
LATQDYARHRDDDVAKRRNLARPVGERTVTTGGITARRDAECVVIGAAQPPRRKCGEPHGASATPWALPAGRAPENFAIDQFSLVLPNGIEDRLGGRIVERRSQRALRPYPLGWEDEQQGRGQPDRPPQ